jgi:hypothetical protein
MHAAGDLFPALRDRPLHGHAAAEGEVQVGEIDLVEAGGVQQTVEQRVHAGDGGERHVAQLLHESGHVARIGDEIVVTAELHEDQAVRRQREDVVQRQRGDDDLLAHARVAPDPGGGLLHVGHQVAVGQHRALGHAGRTAGVLQEGDVFRRDVHFRQRVHLAEGQRVAETDRARDVVLRDHLLDVLQHEIDDHPFGEGEHVAQAGGDDLLHRRVGEHVLHGLAEVVHHQDGARARVDQLVLQLARGVHRIGVHHREAGAQHTEDSDRILQAVGHHDRDAIALLQFQLAQQIRGELFAVTIDLIVGDGLAHVRERRAIAIFLQRRLQHGDDRTVLVDIDLLRHVSRIAGNPRAFLTHRFPSLNSSAANRWPFIVVGSIGA